jgi:hypothetical protein
MATLAQKLQLKPGQPLAVLNVPDGYAEKLAAELEGISLAFELHANEAALLAFVTTYAEVTALLPGATAALGAAGLFWLAYPKGGSGVKTELNRDRLWAAVGQSGWQGVRQVALDETWSAMRFRPADQVGQ